MLSFAGEPAPTLCGLAFHILIHACWLFVCLSVCLLALLSCLLFVVCVVCLFVCPLSAVVVVVDDEVF